MSLAIGLDIGGTKIAAGIVDETGRILRSFRADTPGKDVQLIHSAIVAAIDRLKGDHDVTAVGIGAAGWIAQDRDTVLFSPHLAWRNERLQSALQRDIDVPVFIENDANAAAWAEFRFGAAAHQPVVLGVTLGTGIGGGIIIDGEIFRGAYGLAGEWGHMRVVPDGRQCACGNRGCWEQYASGRALERAARELVESSPVTAAALMAVVDGDPEAINATHVAQVAAAGDPAAKNIVQEVGHWLGQGIADIAAIFDPSMVVIGGGAAQIGSLILDPARKHFKNALAGRGFRPPVEVVGAKLGADAGLIGAADLARGSA